LSRLDRKIITEEQKFEIIKNYLNGESISILCKRIGLSNNTLKNRLKEWGVYVYRGKKIRESGEFTQKEKDTIIELYNSGVGFVQIGKTVKTRPINISKFVKELGIYRPRRNANFKKKITDEDILNKYYELKSIRKVNKFFGINSNITTPILKKHGVEVKDRYLRKRLLEHKNNIYQLRRSGVSIQKIAETYDISYVYCHKILEEWNLGLTGINPRRDPEEETERRKRENELRKTEKENSKLLEIHREHKIRELYKNGVSLDDICKELSITRHMLLNRLRDYGIGLSKERSRALFYYNNNLSEESILETFKQNGNVEYTCNILNISRKILKSVLDKHNIKTENYLRKDYFESNKDNIIKTYKKGYSLGYVSKKFNCSVETIRNFLIKNNIERHPYCVKDTSIEIILKEILEELDIAYKPQHKIERKIFDFYIADYNILIEANGDYWHGNPLKYKKLDSIQKENKLRDLKKLEFAINNNYKILFLWEFEINEFRDKIVNLFKDIKNGIFKQQESIYDFVTNKQ
jgi:transposase-like protein/G:T-mismatch repair DNA endonuclease (very short patch repair protein)